MNDRLTDEEIEEIRGRAEAATEGPWKACVPVKGRMVTQVIGRDVLGNSGVRVADYVIRPDDTRFIAHARTDIPRLLDEVERLRNRVAQMEFKSTTYTEEVEDELTRLTDQAQRDAGKIEMLAEEVERAREERDHCRSCLSSVTYYLTSDPPDTSAAFAAVRGYQRALEATNE